MQVTCVYYIMAQKNTKGTNGVEQDIIRPKISRENIKCLSVQHLGLTRNHLGCKGLE